MQLWEIDKHVDDHAPISVKTWNEKFIWSDGAGKLKNNAFDEMQQFRVILQPKYRGYGYRGAKVRATFAIFKSAKNGPYFR